MVIYCSPQYYEYLFRTRFFYVIKRIDVLLTIVVYYGMKRVEFYTRTVRTSDYRSRGPLFFSAHWHVDPIDYIENTRENVVRRRYYWDGLNTCTSKHSVFYLCIGKLCPAPATKKKSTSMYTLLITGQCFSATTCEWHRFGMCPTGHSLFEKRKEKQFAYLKQYRAWIRSHIST